MLFLYKKISLLSSVFLLFMVLQSFGQQTKGTVQIESTAAIDEMVAQKKDYNKNLKTIRGFRIQLIYGMEKSAYEIKDQFEALFPDIPTIIVFSSPEWKVQVGNYISRLEADRSLFQINTEFPGAIVLATEIDLE